MRHNNFKMRGTILGLLLSSSIFVFSLPIHAQLRQSDGADEEIAKDTGSLLSDLQTLGARAKRLDKPLARAAAQAEIADAAWEHDREWAKQLLREAYELALPAEEQRAKLRKIPVGAHPILPGPGERTRRTLSRRILQVASRDRTFATEIVKSGVGQLGAFEGHVMFASLAMDELEQGDFEATKGYVLESIDADPSQMSALGVIERLATQDRAAADAVIIKYIERLNASALSFKDGSVVRSGYILAKLVYPWVYGGPNPPGSPPAPAVMRAYATYVLENIARLEMVDPGSISVSRLTLLHTYPILRQYAPELMPQFLDLEQRSRKPGETFSLQTAKNMQRTAWEDYEKRMQIELDADQPDEHMIRSTISRGNFAKARKMIDKLPERALKTELTEYANVHEAISLANKGDIFGARSLAEKLAKATYILQAYPVIAAKCVATKDELCARDSVTQAVKQLRKADTSPPMPPAGIPSSVFAGKGEFDPILASLGKLALSVISIKDGLALDVLDELVAVANHSEVDTSQGRTGFESSLFKKLAEKDEGRVTLAALQLEDHLRQIVALAAIDQWKSDKLVANAKLRKRESESSVKKD